MEKKQIFLFAFANDPNQSLNLDKEWRQVEQALEQNLDRGELIFNLIPSATIDEIFHKLNRFHNRITLFHYGGHSDSQTLDLTDVPLQRKSLATFIGQEKNLKLVFLNACSNFQHVAALYKEGVPAVIATSASISDQQAISLSVRFYQALASGRSIGEAFSIAAEYVNNNEREELIGIREIERDIGFVKDKEDFPWGLYVQDSEVLNWRISKETLSRKYWKDEEKRNTIIRYVTRLREKNNKIDEEQVSINDVYVMLQEREGASPSDKVVVIEKKKPKSRILNLKEVINEHSQITLIGEPGSGKTVTLKFLVTDLCRNYLGLHSRLEIKQKYIPVFIDLGKENPKRIDLLIAERFENFVKIDNNAKKAAKKLALEILEDGLIYLVIDSYDEVQTLAKRIEWKECIKNFQSIYPNSPIINAVRLANFRVGVDLEMKNSFSILPLNKNLRKTFVKKWLEVLKDEDQNITADQIIQNLEREHSLKSVIENPLLLKIATRECVRKGLEIFKEFANTRSKLYQLHIDTILDNTLLKIFPQINPEAEKTSQILEDYKYQARIVLQRIALNLRTNIPVTDCRQSKITGLQDLHNVLSNLGDLSSKETEIISGLKFFRFKMGILAASNTEQNCPYCSDSTNCTHYFFIHQTFMEFFVGQWLYERWKKNRKATWRFIQLCLHMAEFREPILLFAGLLGEEADTFIDWVFNAKSNYEYFLFRDISLAAQLIEETGQGQKTKIQLEEKIINILPQISQLNPAGTINIELVSSILRMGTFQDLTRKIILRANTTEKCSILSELFFNYNFKRKKYLDIFFDRLSEFLDDDDKLVVETGLEQLIASRISTDSVLKRVKSKLSSSSSDSTIILICKYLKAINHINTDIIKRLIELYEGLEEVTKLTVENLLYDTLLSDEGFEERLSTTGEILRSPSQFFQILHTKIRRELRINYLQTIRTLRALIWKALDCEILQIKGLGFELITIHQGVEINEEMQKKLEGYLYGSDEALALLAFRTLDKRQEIELRAKVEFVERCLKTARNKEMVMEGISKAHQIFPESKAIFKELVRPFISSKDQSTRTRAEQYFITLSKDNLGEIFRLIEHLGLNHSYFQVNRNLSESIAFREESFDAVGNRNKFPELFFSNSIIIFELIPLLKAEGNTSLQHLGLYYYAAHFFGLENESYSYFKSYSEEDLHNNVASIQKMFQVPIPDFHLLTQAINQRINFFDNDILRSVINLWRSAPTKTTKQKIGLYLVRFANKIDIKRKVFKELVNGNHFEDLLLGLEILKKKKAYLDLLKIQIRLLKSGDKKFIFLVFRMLKNQSYPLSSDLVPVLLPLINNRNQFVRRWALNFLENFIRQERVFLLFMEIAKNAKGGFSILGEIAIKALKNFRIEGSRFISEFKSIIELKRPILTECAFIYFSNIKYYDNFLVEKAQKLVDSLIALIKVDKIHYEFHQKSSFDTPLQNLSLVLIEYLCRSPTDARSSYNDSLEFLSFRINATTKKNTHLAIKQCYHLLDNEDWQFAKEATIYLTNIEYFNSCVQAKMTKLLEKENLKLSLVIGKYFIKVGYCDDQTLNKLTHHLIKVYDRNAIYALLNVLISFEKTNTTAEERILHVLESSDFSRIKILAIKYFTLFGTKNAKVKETMKNLLNSPLAKVADWSKTYLETHYPADNFHSN